MNFAQARFTDVVFKGFYSTQQSQSSNNGGGGGLLDDQNMLSQSIDIQGNLVQGSNSNNNNNNNSSDEEMKDEYDTDAAANQAASNPQ